jgi:hypothetical protein
MSGLKGFLTLAMEPRNGWLKMTFASARPAMRPRTGMSLAPTQSTGRLRISQVNLLGSMASKVALPPARSASMTMCLIGVPTVFSMRP